jgi:hypothetical protein
VQLKRRHDERDRPPHFFKGRVYECGIAAIGQDAGGNRSANRSLIQSSQGQRWCQSKISLLKRIEEMKANAIEATPVINGEKVDVHLPPRFDDRRFRRI